MRADATTLVDGPPAAAARWQPRAVPLSIFVLSAWLYGPVVLGLVREWLSSADSSYGAALAAVAVAVAWQRRGALVPASSGSGAAGLLLFIAGLLTYVAGQFAGDLYLTRFSIVPLAAGGLWFLAGWRGLRALTAPVVLLLFAIPLPAPVVNAITMPLQLVASRVAELTLSGIGVPVFRDGNLLFLPSGTLEVAEACSGLRSLISLVAVTGLVGWMMRLPRTRIAALVALTVPIAIVANGLRVAAVGLAAEAWGPRTATGTWHTVAGWITFAAALGVVAAVDLLLPRRRARREAALS